MPRAARRAHGHERRRRVAARTAKQRRNGPDQGQRRHEGQGPQQRDQLGEGREPLAPRGRLRPGSDPGRPGRSGRSSRARQVPQVPAAPCDSWASVDAAGTLVRNKGVASTQKLAVGDYLVIFNQDVTPCIYQATARAGRRTGLATGQVTAAAADCDRRGVYESSPQNSTRRPDGHSRPSCSVFG